MAELGIIASVMQIADTGLRLSIKLYTFGEIVSTADKSVISISKDVSLTSSVLKELGSLLESDAESQVFSMNAVQTADIVVKECLEVFQEMEAILVNKLPSLSGQDGTRGVVGGKRSKATALFERLKWGYLQPKLDLLRSNLDRLKSTLLLMLNVITYARQISEKSEPSSVIEYQKSLIEDLAGSNQDYIRKFESLKLGIQHNARAPEEAVQSHPTAYGTQSQRGKDIYGRGLEEKRGLKPIESANANAEDIHINANALGILAPQTFETAEHAVHGQTVEPRNDILMSHLKHYLSLVNNLLDEVDKAKYEIRGGSRNGIRHSISQAYQREMRPLDISTQPSEALSAKVQLAPLIAGVQRRLEQAVGTEKELLDLQRSPDTFDEQFQEDFQAELELPAVQNDYSRRFEDDLNNGDVVGRFDSLSSWEDEKNEYTSYDASGSAYDTYQDTFYRNASPPATMDVADALKKPAEENERRINPMSGYEVNGHGQIMNEGGELIGLVTASHLPSLIGLKVDDNGHVVDTEGNRVGECTLIENLQEDERPTEDEIRKPHELNVMEISRRGQVRRPSYDFLDSMDDDCHATEGPHEDHERSGLSPFVQSEYTDPPIWLDLDPGPIYSYRRALWMGPRTGSVADELLALWTLLPRGEVA